MIREEDFGESVLEPHRAPSCEHLAELMAGFQHQVILAHCLEKGNSYDVSPPDCSQRYRERVPMDDRHFAAVPAIKRLTNQDS
jgi:hypothetical protein